MVCPAWLKPVYFTEGLVQPAHSGNITTIGGLKCVLLPCHVILWSEIDFHIYQTGKTTKQFLVRYNVQRVGVTFPPRWNSGPIGTACSWGLYLMLHADHEGAGIPMFQHLAPKILQDMVNFGPYIDMGLIWIDGLRKKMVLFLLRVELATVPQRKQRKHNR